MKNPTGWKIKPNVINVVTKAEILTVYYAIKQRNTVIKNKEVCAMKSKITNLLETNALLKVIIKLSAGFSTTLDVSLGTIVDLFTKLHLNVAIKRSVGEQIALIHTAIKDQKFLFYGKACSRLQKKGA